MLGLPYLIRQNHRSDLEFCCRQFLVDSLRAKKTAWVDPTLGTRNLEQWFLTFPNLGTPIPKDIGSGTPCQRNLQRKCMLKEQTLL